MVWIYAANYKESPVRLFDRNNQVKEIRYVQKFLLLQKRMYKKFNNESTFNSFRIRKQFKTHFLLTVYHKNLQQIVLV